MRKGSVRAAWTRRFARGPPSHTLWRSMGTGAARWADSALAALVAAAACLPGSGPALDPVFDDAGTPPPTSLGDDAACCDELDLGPPFAVTGPAAVARSLDGRDAHDDRRPRLLVEHRRSGSARRSSPASDVFASNPTRPRS